MSQTIKAIETLYAGCRFRSRLEARWAIFFDALGWGWEYEPFDANGYIPDFVLTGPLPVLVEVKPVAAWADYVAHADKLERALDGVWFQDILIVGLSPAMRVIDWPGITKDYPWGASAKCIGLMSDYWPDEERGWEPAHWDFRSDPWGDIQAMGFFHPYNSYAARPHGRGDNSHPRAVPGAEHILDAWATTRNPTRWKQRHR